MKKKVIVLGIAIGVIVVGSLIKSYYHQVQEKEYDRIRQIRYYANVSETFKLGSYYYSTNDPVKVRYYPTSYTQYRVERWKVLAELLPYIEYPEALIKENKWEEAVRMLEEDIEAYRDYYSSKEYSEQEVMVHPREVMAFIGDNSRSDNVTELLEEANFED
ncbi:hypothetical protein [Amphibacillus cookii]|uniref:hypothetical protein n=1 Tax=Amphibacillus cookii TaxID=767787 RepID=UPI0019572556|nr:hypothetical protein [Amphibacillus cookii]MBM7542733.1 Na+-transporting NADH:ubiquinone oxidoreductase subunit NqrC [Amphibacillus cookii]